MRDTLRDNWQFGILGVVAIFMIWVRTQNWSNFVRGNEVWMAGNDAWYHYRSTVYIAKHFPWNMHHEIFTGYPVGRLETGQFGTLFDQIAAVVAIIHSSLTGTDIEMSVGLVLLFIPVVWAAATIIPVYWIGTQLSGKGVGIISVILLSIMPGAFFSRGIVGFADHHVAEVFMMALSVAVMFWSIRLTFEEFPVYEVVTDIQDHKWTIISSVLTGVVFGLYTWIWPPGILIVGIYGVFIVTYSLLGHKDGTWEPLVFHVTVTMSSLSVMGIIGMLFYRRGLHLAFEPSGLTLFHIVLPLLIGMGAFTLGWISRYVSQNGLDDITYPTTVAGGFVFLSVTLFFVTPDMMDTVLSQFFRVFGLGVEGGATTIAEARPLSAHGTINSVLFSQYGYVFVLAIVGIGMLVYDDKSYKSIFMVIWSIFMVSAAFTQMRFNYYLVIPVVLLAAYAIWRIFDMADINQIEALEDVETYQVVIIALLVVMIIPGLIYPSVSVIDRGQNVGPGSYAAWHGSLTWMNENSDDPGLDPYGTYSAEENDFAYPNGSYGVMSWWDYGHWITVTAERIPVANPFQQNANDAAEYLLAEDEDEAERVIDKLSDNEDHEVKYVVVDWQMVMPNSKFNAPVVFHPNLSTSDMIEPIYIQDERGVRSAFFKKSQRYFESLMVRLFLYHGSAKLPDPVVMHYEYRSYGGPQIPVVPEGKTPVGHLETMQQALQYADSNSNAHIGGVGKSPPQKVGALEHYRLVHVSDVSAIQSGQYRNYLNSEIRAGAKKGHVTPQSSWVKVFERVEGATLVGETEPNTTVMAATTLKLETGESFVYRNFENSGSDGQFEITVPYSTGMNGEVEAVINYEVISQYDNVTERGFTEVPEEAVQNGETIEVEMEKDEE